MSKNNTMVSLPFLYIWRTSFYLTLLIHQCLWSISYFSPTPTVHIHSKPSNHCHKLILFCLQKPSSILQLVTFKTYVCCNKSTLFFRGGPGCFDALGKMPFHCCPPDTLTPADPGPLFGPAVMAAPLPALQC